VVEVDAEEGLSEEEVEQFTDVMVGKLSLIYAHERSNPESEHWLTSDKRSINRDEIRQVIVDTELLVTGKVPLDRWLEGAAGA
jgi:hypothetical protein